MLEKEIANIYVYNIYMYAHSASYKTCLKLIFLLSLSVFGKVTYNLLYISMHFDRDNYGDPRQNTCGNVLFHKIYQ